MSLKNGSTKLRNCACVNSSLNSNSWNLAAVAIAFSRRINNLRTLIRSNALGFARAVLSPNRTVPLEGTYWINSSRIENVSLCLGWVKRKFNCTTNLTSVETTRREEWVCNCIYVCTKTNMSPFNGTKRYTSLNLSYIYLYPLSNTA